MINTNLSDVVFLKFLACFLGLILLIMLTCRILDVRALRKYYKGVMKNSIVALMRRCRDNIVRIYESDQSIPTSGHEVINGIANELDLSSERKLGEIIDDFEKFIKTLKYFLPEKLYKKIAVEPLGIINKFYSESLSSLAHHGLGDLIGTASAIVVLEKKFLYTLENIEAVGR